MVGAARAGGRGNKADRDRALELHGKGLTTTQIAQRLGCSRRTVAQIVRTAKADGRDGQVKDA